jgi:hypothetical protein
LNLEKEILQAHSKHNVVRVAKLIDQDKRLFESLTRIYFDQSRQDLARKAAWVLRQCVEQYPHMILPYQRKLVSYIGKEGHHDAIKRNGLAILEFIPISEKLYGPLINICFKFLMNGKEPVAIKAYSMSILDKISRDIPEIRQELKLVLQELLPYESIGFKTRAKKILSTSSEV